MPNVYTLGQKVRVAVQFQKNGLDANPTTITLRVRKPDLTTVTYIYGVASEIVQESTGNFYADVSGDKDGRWRYRWIGTGNVETAIEGNFVVRSTVFS